MDKLRFLRESRIRRWRAPLRRGTALLVCIFAISVTTVIVVSMLSNQMLQLTALRYTEQYERAQYLAGAGVHHALAELELMAGPVEPFTVGPVEFPTGSGDVYEADVAQVGMSVVVTARGSSGGVSRYLKVTVGQGSQGKKP